MKRPLTVLAALRIDRPCPAAWDAMPGDDRSRHCAACDRPVHDLSALTAAEAAELLAGPVTPCVRVHRRADGSVVTHDAAGRGRRVLTRVLLAAASWAGLAVAAGCREKYGTTMGEPCVEPQPAVEPAKLPVAPPPRPVVRAPDAPADAGEPR